MKKILILAISLIGTLSLTGCANTKVNVKGNCGGNSPSSMKCSGSATVTRTFKSTDSAFNANFASVNLSESTGTLISNTGTIAVNIRNPQGVIVASKVFNWYSSGSSLYPSDPTQLNNWVNSLVQDNYQLEFDVTGIETSASLGTNTITAIFKYENYQVGGSASDYLNNADLNGF